MSTNKCLLRLLTLLSIGSVCVIVVFLIGSYSQQHIHFTTDGTPSILLLGHSMVSISSSVLHKLSEISHTVNRLVLVVNDVKVDHHSRLTIVRDDLHDEHFLSSLARNHHVTGVVTTVDYFWRVKSLLNENKNLWIIVLSNRQENETRNMLEWYHGPMQVLLLPHIYGSSALGDDWLISHMVEKALADLPIVVRDLNEEIQLVHMDEVVASILESLPHNSTVTSFKKVMGKPIRVKTLIEMVLKLTHSQSTLVESHPTTTIVVNPPETNTFSNTTEIYNKMATYIQSLYETSLKMIQEMENQECHRKHGLHRVGHLLEGCFVSLQHGFSTLSQRQFRPSIPQGEYMTVRTRDYNSIVLEERDQTRYHLDDIRMNPHNFTFHARITENGRALFSDLTHHENTHPFSLHVQCCPSKSSLAWQFSKESPFFVKNFRTQSLGTMCERYGRVRNYLTQSMLHLGHGDTSTHDPNQIIHKNTRTVTAEDNDTAAICENKCGYPGVCLRDGHCRCTFEPSCTTHPPISIPVPHNFSRNDVLTHDGKTIGRSCPKIHILQTTLYDSNLQHPSCQDKNPHEQSSFSMDLHLIKALESISTDVKSADYVLIPYYQGCMAAFNGNRSLAILEHLYHRFKQENPKFSGQFVTLASHDYGACSSLRGSNFQLSTKQAEIFKQMHVVQANGDYAFPCYLPHKDVVAPPHSKWTRQLIQKFHTVKPSHNRRHFLFFSGRKWGTGRPTRTSLMDCPVLQQTLREGDYLSQLGETKFCLLVAGIVGWSFRMGEAMYAGCVPVFVSEYLHPPFGELVDWGQVSVWIHPMDVNRVEEILRGIPERQVRTMQEKMLLVRDLFVYGEEMGGSVKEWTPQDFVLRELYLRLKRWNRT